MFTGINVKIREWKCLVIIKFGRLLKRNTDYSDDKSGSSNRK